MGSSSSLSASDGFRRQFPSIPHGRRSQDPRTGSLQSQQEWSGQGGLTGTFRSKREGQQLIYVSCLGRKRGRHGWLGEPLGGGRYHLKEGARGGSESYERSVRKRTHREGC